MRYAAMLLVAGALLGVAPVAVAATDPGSVKSCTSKASATKCVSPGNNEITAHSPNVQFQSQYPAAAEGQ